MTVSQATQLDITVTSASSNGSSKVDTVVSVSEVDVASLASSDDEDRYLVVSPYTEQEHLLDLLTLDTENQLLAIALVNMKCLRPDYATAPYQETFNWEEIIQSLRALAEERGHKWKETSFFVVAFRSQIPPTTVYAELGELDKAAHKEATESGGFLKYGSPVPSAR